MRPTDCSPLVVPLVTQNAPRSGRTPMNQPEPISSGLASLLFGLCYGFIAGIAFTLILRAVL